MERKRTRILKTLSAVILVVGILMCLTGCLRYESRAKVNADGTVDFGFLYAIADISGSDSGSMDSAASFNFNLSNASLRSLYLLPSSGNTPEKTIGSAFL